MTLILIEFFSDEEILRVWEDIHFTWIEGNNTFITIHLGEDGISRWKIEKVEYMFQPDGKDEDGSYTDHYLETYLYLKPADSLSTQISKELCKGDGS